MTVARKNGAFTIKVFGKDEPANPAGLNRNTQEASRA
jgi:hypothetical protein